MQKSPKSQLLFKIITKQNMILRFFSPSPLSQQGHDLIDQQASYVHNLISPFSNYLKFIVVKILFEPEQYFPKQRVRLANS